MPKALLVSYHFPPSSAVGALRPGRLARLLPDFGYEVDVVCASVGRRRGELDPSRVHLVPESSRVVRVGTPWVLGRDPSDLPKSHAFLATAWWKGRAYSEWLFLTKDWSWRWGRAARRVVDSLFEKESFDLLILDAPPNPSVAPLIELATSRGVPCVLDLRDVWWCGEERRRPVWWRGSPRLRRLRWERELRNEAVRGSKHVVLTSPEMARVMSESFPDLDPSRFSAVTNAYEEVDPGLEAPERVGPGLDPSERVDPGLEAPGKAAEMGELRIVYAGSLSYGRMEQAKQLIRGMGELRRQEGPKITALFIGDGGPDLVQGAQEEGITDRVLVRGWIERDQATLLQRKANALLLLQPSDQVETRVAIPGKLFDYMARRRNVFALVGSGPASDLIRNHGLGVVVSSGDPRQIADALRKLVERVRAEPVLPIPPEEFSERSTVGEFARILDSVVG